MFHFSVLFFSFFVLDLDHQINFSLFFSFAMGGVLQTLKFLSAAAGVGLCLNGMDKLAQRIDECV